MIVNLWFRRPSPIEAQPEWPGTGTARTIEVPAATDSSVTVESGGQ